MKVSGDDLVHLAAVALITLSRLLSRFLELVHQVEDAVGGGPQLANDFAVGGVVLIL